MTKDLHPELSKKTHFKAAVSFQLKLPDSLKNNELGMAAKSTPRGRLPPNQNDFSRLEEEQRENPRGLPPIKDLDSYKRSESKKRDGFKRSGLTLGGALDDYLVDSVDEKDQHSKERRKPSKTEVHEHALPSAVVKDTLIRCNYISKPNQNVRKLHPGEGIFFGDPNLRVKDIYNSILRKN